MEINEKSSRSGKYTYHPMQMHLHTCHQPGGSMEGHIYNAASLGMKYIRFTDHDTRTGPKKNPVNGFDFSCGELMHETEKTTFGWEVAEGLPSDVPTEYKFVDGRLRVVCGAHDGASDKWTTLHEMSFKSSGKSHTVSLLANVMVRLGVSFTPTENTRLLIGIRMSQRPPEHTPARLVYCLGEMPDGATPHYKYIQLASDGLLEFFLGDEALLDGIGGLDNVFDTVILTLQSRGDSGGEYALDRFEIEAELGFNDVIVRQRVLADEIGRRYGVKPFVTSEISGAGVHKNCFSTAVPIIDYNEYNYEITEMEAIAHVKKYGGIFSYNHPFESYKRQDISPDEKERILYNLAAEFSASKVLGATLMEVGFCVGRNQFSLDDHLRLWDLLSLSGVFITGYGDSDSHHNNGGWFKGNNFAAWIAAESDEFPAPEEEFIASMKAGRVYMGDPVIFGGKLSFTAEDGCEQGSIFTCVGRGMPLKLEFNAEVGESWTARVVIDREVTEIALNGGEFSYEFELESKRTVSFARVELYDENERCVALTNPIYYVRSDEFARKLPPERLAKRRIDK